MERIGLAASVGGRTAAGTTSAHTSPRCPRERPSHAKRGHQHRASSPAAKPGDFGTWGTQESVVTTKPSTLPNQTLVGFSERLKKTSSLLVSMRLSQRIIKLLEPLTGLKSSVPVTVTTLVCCVVGYVTLY